MLNTCIGLGVAVKHYNDKIATQRFGTHDIELFFGLIRCLSCYDNSFANAIRLTVEIILVKQFSNDLDSSIKIQKRENEAGIVLTKQINSQKDLDFDCLLLENSIYRLMRGEEIKGDDIQKVEQILDGYTRLITSRDSHYKTIKIPNICRGSLPIHRYNILKYSMSVLPLPKKESSFEFYCSNKNFNKKLEKVSIFQWCVRLCALLNGMHFKCKKKTKIPFDNDLNNAEDIERIVEFLTDPLMNSKSKTLIDYLVSEDQKNKSKIFK